MYMGSPVHAGFGLMPFVPDLAIIFTPPETIPAVIRDLGHAKVKTP